MEKNILNRFFAYFSRLTVGQWRRRRHFDKVGFRKLSPLVSEDTSGESLGPDRKRLQSLLRNEINS